MDILSPPLFAPHDAGTIAWIIVAAYAGAFVLALTATVRTSGTREGWFWALTAAGLLLLGLNKQLDLQTLLTATLRQLARQDGWYEQRRMVQLVFIAGLAGALLAALVFLRWLTRFSRPGVKLALSGLCLLAAFVMLRAASFHHVDILLGGTLGGLKLHALLELAGILLTAAGALIALTLRPA